MSHDETIVRFDDVSFAFEQGRTILDGVSFSVRKGSKMTCMGQNGAGKSTILKLIMGEYVVDEGVIHRERKCTVAMARQVIAPEERDLTVREFFAAHYGRKAFDIEKHIKAVLDIVHLHAPLDRVVSSFSGGQQARLLLASALIQDPDLLLLDEPTNNLDKEGIKHLTEFLVKYKKTCIVISHDAAFLNAFTHGVLYLDVFSHTVEQYFGNYTDVVRDISVRIQKEQQQNAQLAKKAQANKAQANVFAHKGGKLRLVAKKMRDAAEEMENRKVVVRKEDTAIRPFVIPAQRDLSGEVLGISSFSVMKNHVPVTVQKKVSLRKNTHMLLSGPNGIGKSTLLEAVATGTAEGARVGEGVVVGYYRQDFSTLDFEQTIYECLTQAVEESVEGATEEHLRSTAAGFLMRGDTVHTKIGHLSEGQKGLVAFAQLVLQRPGLLILDEPTNHINFRHLPVIAEALNKYEGAMVLVSHVPEFVAKIRIDEVVQLDR